MYNSAIKILKIKNLNALLLGSIFLFLTLWWGVVYFVLNHSNPSANRVWSTYYQILAILGAYIGFFVYRSIVNSANGISKKTILFISAGLLFQALGQTTYLIYAFVLGVAIPHPSYGDIFYLGSILLYVAALGSLYYQTIPKHERRKSFFTATNLCLVLVLLQAWLLSKTQYKLSWSLSTASLDLVFLIIEPIYAALALGAIVGTKFFKNSKFSVAYSLLMFGLVFQYIADFYFLYSTNAGAWALTGGGDYLCMLAYFVISLGIVQFTTSFIAINIFAVLFNASFFIQFVLSDSKDKFFSNGIILLVCIVTAYFLLRRNRNEVLQREKITQLEALQESHTRLLALDKQKTEFLNIAAHQLRTPASIINNYVAMLQDGDFGEVNPEVQTVHKHIAESNQWLVRLADEFLNISNLEQGNTKFRMAVVDMGALVDTVVKEVTPKATAKSLTFEWSRPTEPIPVKVDEEKIKHSILNYLDNAIKYTPSGKIKVQIAKNTNGVAVTVSDTGIGFDEDDQKNFFQKFHRGKNAHQIEVNTSTGLGLYICRKFIEGHHGQVWAKSAGVGKGSEFGFSLPV